MALRLQDLSCFQYFPFEKTQFVGAVLLKLLFLKKLSGGISI